MNAIIPGRKIEKGTLHVKNVDYIRQIRLQRKCFVTKNFCNTDKLCQSCKYFTDCKSLIEKYGTITNWKIKQIQEDKK